LKTSFEPIFCRRLELKLHGRIQQKRWSGNLFKENPDYDFDEFKHESLEGSEQKEMQSN
jgi:hypothetical protein